MFEVKEELEDLRATVREFFAKRSTEADVRRLMETEDGFDPAFWQSLTELGLLSMVVPTEFGGDGYGFCATGVVMEEMGRASVCAPYLSTIMAVNLLVESGDSAVCARYLPSMAEGTLRATVALADLAGNLDGRGVTATRSGDSILLNGQKSFVIDGHTADTILVVVQTPSGTSLFACDRSDPGLHATPLPTFDQTRKQAALVFTDVKAQLIGEENSHRAAVQRAIDLTLVVLASEQAGGAARALEMAVEYAQQRIQFGRVIGSFQAIKHLLADLLVSVESAISAARYVAALADTDRSGLANLANLAKFYCSEAFLEATNTNIQVHGGIGFTWEHPAHLYLRRARSSSIMLGDSQFHRAQFMQRNFGES